MGLLAGGTDGPCAGRILTKRYYTRAGAGAGKSLVLTRLFLASDCLFGHELITLYSWV